MLICMTTWVSAQNSALNGSLIFWGELSLFESLDSLRNTGLSIAYSPDKLTNQTLSIEKGLSVKDFFDQLEDELIADIKYNANQIIVSPHKPRTYTVHGVIKNAESGEHVIGATVQIEGYYTITVMEGDYRFQYSHINFAQRNLEISLYRNIYLDVSVAP